MEIPRTIALPSDGGEAQLLALPFAPGDSCFQVKGNAYQGHMAYVAREVPGGVEAQRTALRELHPRDGDALVSFLDQRFYTAGWYDTYPLAIAGIACGRLTGLPFLEFVRARTDWQARQDLGSLYRFLLRFVTAEALALRVPTIAARYFDYVKARSGTPEEGTVPGILEGIPLELVPWWIALLEAYVSAVLELAGNFSASFENGPFEEIGEKDGRRLVRIHTRVSLRGGREAVDPELADI